MPFPDEAWCHQAITLFNDDADAPLAVKGWSGDFGLVVDGPTSSLGIYLGAPVSGRIPAPQFESVATLEARNPSYFTRATQADWLALIDGSLDVIAAIVQRRLIAKGDLTPVLMRLKYRGLADRWLAQIREGQGR
jgi:hypothetical protein